MHAILLYNIFLLPFSIATRTASYGHTGTISTIMVPSRLIFCCRHASAVLFIFVTGGTDAYFAICWNGTLLPLSATYTHYSILLRMRGCRLILGLIAFPALLCHHATILGLRCCVPSSALYGGRYNGI